MAKKSVNKSALVRDYLSKYPEKGPTAIAHQINEDKGVKISGKFVATVKTKLKQSPGTTASTATAPAPAAAPAKKKPAPADAKSTPAKSVATSAASAAALSQHIANLKAAAQRLGKDEAKRIIDLF